MKFESVSFPEQDWEQCILVLRCEIAALKLRLTLLHAADVARLEAKYSPDQPRVPAGSSDGGQWMDGGGGGQLGDVTGDEESFGGFGRAEDQVAQNNRGRGSVRVGGQFFEATPAQTMRLSIATGAANTSTARVREIDPNWRPSPSVYESVEGLIAAREAELRQAEGRLAELLRGAIPRTNPSWGVNRLRKELNDLGYRFVEPTDAEGYLYKNNSGAEVRIMRTPEQQYRTDPFQKHLNDYYYRYRSGGDQKWGQHTTIPNKDANR